MEKKSTLLVNRIDARSLWRLIFRARASLRIVELERHRPLIANFRDYENLNGDTRLDLIRLWVNDMQTSMQIFR